MKSVITLLLLFPFVGSFAQTPQNGRFEFYKRIADVAPGIQITYEATPEEVENALDVRLGDATSRSLNKVRRDLYVHEGITVPTIAAQTLDYYFRIEEVSGQRDSTRVTLFLALGNDNFMDQSTYPDEWSAARHFLLTLNETIAGRHLLSALDEMEDALTAAEEELDDLQDQGKDLEKEQEKLQEELEQVIENRRATQEAISKQEQLVEQLREQVEALNDQTDN